MELMRQSMRLSTALFSMSRPPQLLLLNFVYVLGSIIAWAHGASLDASQLVLGSLVYVPFAASIHYANEYADHETDALTRRTPYSGGSGALQRFELPPRTALWAAWVSLLVGVILALLLLMLGRLPALGFLLLGGSALLGWMYSLPPLQLAWRGWGEIVNVFLGAIVTPLYGYVLQRGCMHAALVLACLPFACLTFTNLLGTTWSDRRADVAVGKHMLATRFSLGGLRWLYAGLLVCAYGSLLAMAGSVLPESVAWCSLLVLPLSLWGWLRLGRQHSPFPSVVPMAAMLAVQVVAWCWFAGMG